VASLIRVTTPQHPLIDMSIRVSTVRREGMTSESDVMLLPQGDLRLLATPVALTLLNSTKLARLAFNALDGTPRLIPTWFVWNGEEVVMTTFIEGATIGIRHPARRIAYMRANPDVALSIDADGARPVALLIRGRAAITEADGYIPEHVSATRRYLGIDESTAENMLDPAAHPGLRMARIGVRPTWVGLIDFDTRMPSPRGGVLHRRG
jgi:pyridoxamine 5'-phosphate oxidase-like protein